MREPSVGDVKVNVTINGEIAEVLKALHRLDSTLIDKILVAVHVPEPPGKMLYPKSLPEIQAGNGDLALENLRYVERRLGDQHLRNLEHLIRECIDITKDREAKPDQE